MKVLIAAFLLLISTGIAASQTNEYDSFLTLTKQVAATSAAGKSDESATLARSLLTAAKAFLTDWNYGNAVHVAHLALGRAAMASGDLQEAEKQLLVSVDPTNLPYGIEMAKGLDGTPNARPAWKASPSMDSFGPDMLLAKELLARGRKDAVLKYFELCRAFWSSDRGRLADWSGAVEQGLTPDFGPNLVYFFAK